MNRALPFFALGFGAGIALLAGRHLAPASAAVVIGVIVGFVLGALTVLFGLALYARPRVVTHYDRDDGDTPCASCGS